MLEVRAARRDDGALFCFGRDDGALFCFARAARTAPSLQLGFRAGEQRRVDDLDAAPQRRDAVGPPTGGARPHLRQRSGLRVRRSGLSRA